jgi:RNA polymerase sigma-70 factor, ECF subfamily
MNDDRPTAPNRARQAQESPGSRSAGATGGADRALIAGVASGDERALDAVREQFGAAMRAVAMRVTRSSPLAEEVVQDALLAVWRQPARYDPDRGALGPWLLSLTRYKAIDAVRREAAATRGNVEADLSLREAPDDVHDAVWLELRRERLREAMGQLGPDQRRALELAFLGGLTHVEVAEREHIPLGTAKTRIRTALLRLRAILGPSLEDALPPAVTQARPSDAPAPRENSQAADPAPPSAARARSNRP